MGGRTGPRVLELGQGRGYTIFERARIVVLRPGADLRLHFATVSLGMQDDRDGARPGTAAGGERSGHLGVVGT